VQAGKVRVEYHPMAFLDDASSTRYSTRALNAAGCVLDTTPSAFEKFHDLLYANQPKEKSAGLPDSQLIDYAKQAGAGDISSCVKDLKFEGWTKRVTDQASKDGVVSTPTVFVDGKKLENVLDPTAVKSAIEAALAK
jgi:protein-disulfide isomerase